MVRPLRFEPDTQVDLQPDSRPLTLEIAIDAEGLEGPVDRDAAAAGGATIRFPVMARLPRLRPMMSRPPELS